MTIKLDLPVTMNCGETTWTTRACGPDGEDHWTRDLPGKLSLEQVRARGMHDCASVTHRVYQIGLDDVLPGALVAAGLDPAARVLDGWWAGPPVGHTADCGEIIGRYRVRRGDPEQTVWLMHCEQGHS